MQHLCHRQLSQLQLQITPFSSSPVIHAYQNQREFCRRLRWEKDYPLSLAIYIHFLPKVWIFHPVIFLPFHSAQNGSVFKRYAKKIYSIFQTLLYSRGASRQTDRLRTPHRGQEARLCCRRGSSLMPRHAISFETVQGRPVTMVESFHQRVGFSFSDGTRTWKKTLSACESKHRAWIQRELPKDTTTAPFRQALSPQREPALSAERRPGDGPDDLIALFISDFCFYDSQSWRPRRSEGISKQPLSKQPKCSLLLHKWHLTWKNAT